jgi:hypothetical protein
VTTPAGTPIHPRFRIIGGLSLRFAESGAANVDALPRRLSGSERQWVLTGLAAAGAFTGRDVT